METIIASLVVSLAALTIFRLNSVTPFIRITFSSDDYLNSHLKYQLALLVLAITVLAVTYAQNPMNLRILFSVGNISAPANPVEWFGTGSNRSWVFAGLYLSVIITTGTIVFVYLQFRHLKVSIAEVFPYIGWVLLFSLSNSFLKRPSFGSALSHRPWIESTPPILH